MGNSRPASLATYMKFEANLEYMRPAFRSPYSDFFLVFLFFLSKSLKIAIMNLKLVSICYLFEEKVTFPKIKTVSKKSGLVLHIEKWLLFLVSVC